MKIENNTEKVKRGTYAIVAQLNGGTGTTLSISIAGGTPIAIEDGAFTADATKKLSYLIVKFQALAVVVHSLI